MAAETPDGMPTVRNRPPLVIVSGAPGSGKTILARRLADDLRLPLVARDALKEALADELLDDLLGHELTHAEASSSLGRAAYSMLFTVTDALLRSGCGLIVESNFRRGLSEPELELRVGVARAVVVHCQATDAVTVARYRARHAQGARHRVHRDDDRLGGLHEDLALRRFEPLELGIETIRLDTNDGYTPSIEQVIARIRDVMEP